MKKSNAAALARYASSLIDGGREAIDVLACIMRDTRGSFEGGATTAERMAAAKELLDRTCGKSAQVIEHDVTVKGASYDVSRLSAERLTELRATLRDLAIASGAPVPLLAEPESSSTVIDVVPLEPVEDLALEWDEPEDE